MSSISLPFNNPPLIGSLDDTSVPNAAAVTGQGGHNPGVIGSSTHADGVRGLTETREKNGVVGINQTIGASGFLGGIDLVFGQHAGAYGQSDQAGVFGHATNNTGTGVYGHSIGQDAVSELGGFGVRGETVAGIGVQGRSFGKGLAGKFIGDVEVTGDIRLINSDIAEDFCIAGTDELEPGTVMVFDTDGALLRSRHAYDKRVAGVLSGAGGYKPGIILDRRESHERRLPVALMGKVYCRVDASHAPIEVGDLLTTSSTPGHAMKADDVSRAFGSVIGKALRPLQSGVGLIPVLVALQ